MAMAHSKVTAQGQISVPAEIRKKLGVGPAHSDKRIAPSTTNKMVQQAPSASGPCRERLSRGEPVVRSGRAVARSSAVGLILPAIFVSNLRTGEKKTG